MTFSILSRNGGLARKLAVAGALASVAVLAVPSVASATTDRSGIEHFRIVSSSAARFGVVIAKGVFADGGKDYQHANRDLFVFPNGAFTVHHPGGNFSFTLNRQTCIGHIDGTGDYTIDNGYGFYKHITGSGTYDFHGTLTFGRHANTGKCAFRRGPTAEQDVVKASGPISM
jgi:hypothetical protein